MAYQMDASSDILAILSAHGKHHFSRCVCDTAF